MKTSKDEILMTSVRLFASRGFDAVSTSMIAGELGITKGALYRHFENKQQIFDSIIQKMFELDAARAGEDHVPEKTYEEDPESYRETQLPDLCEFTANQFTFWTEDTFASAFRRMITIEQYRNAESQKLYQDVICRGPVKYTADLFTQMIDSGQLNQEAKTLGAETLAIRLFSSLSLMIQLADGGMDPEICQTHLRALTDDFKDRYLTK